MELLTTSRMKAARLCQRYHHLRYELGYRPVETDDVLRFGTLIHAGLEAWFLAHQDGAGSHLERAIDAIQGEADPYDKARAVALLTGYHLRWQEQPYRVVGVEVEFRAPMRNPATGAASRTWELGGKIDAIVEDLRDGRALLVEHKTSSESLEPGGAYWRRLRMDGQVSQYYAGARAALGLDVQGCVYDVVAKPALRPSAIPLLDADGVKIVLDAQGERVRTKDGKKWRESASSADGFTLQTRPETPEEFQARLMEAIAADPDRYFSRGEVVRLDAEMDEAAFDAWQLGQQIRESQLAGRHPRNPDACIRFGKPCPFFDVCSGAASLEDPTLFRRSENVHPELAEASK